MDRPAPKKKACASAAAPVPALEENLFVSTMTVEEKVAVALSVGVRKETLIVK